jgi:hypothetical protein
MAAPTINANLTRIDDAAVTTGWAGFSISGGGTPTPQQDQDIFIQGAAAVSVKISGSNQHKGTWYNNGSGIDMTVTGRHLYIWANYLTPGNLGTYDGSTEYGLQVIVSTSGAVATDYLAWTVADRVEKPLGWVRYTIDCNKTPTLSAGTTTLTSVQYFGMAVDQTGTAKSENLVVDAIDYGFGLQVEDGDTADPATWLAAWEDDDAIANQYGIITRNNGVYTLRGGIEIGDAASTATTLWKDTSNAQVRFANPLYFLGSGQEIVRVSSIDAPNLYSISGQGNATGTTDITLGQVVGSGDDRQGVLGSIISSDGPKFNVDFETDIADLDTVNFYGTIFQGGGVLQFDSSTKTDLIGCQFIECDDVQPNLSENLNNKVIAPTDRGMEVVTSSTTKQTDFIGGSTAATGHFDKVWNVDVSATPDLFLNYTDEAGDTTTADVVFFPATDAVGDYCAFGSNTKFGRIRIDIATSGTGGVGTWEYYNGSGWTAFTTDEGLDDRSSFFTAATGFRNVNLPNPLPEDWARTSLNNEEPLFYVRAVISTVFTTNPVGDECRVAQTAEKMVHLPTAGTYTAEAWKFFGTGTGRKFDVENPTVSTVVDSYAVSNADALQNLGNGTIIGVAQSFAGSATTLTNARWYLQKNSAPTGNATCKLYAANTGGGSGTHIPTGAALATSNTFDVTELFTTVDTLIDFEFEDEFLMSAATTYCIALEYSGGDATNRVEVNVDTSAASHAGNFSTLTGSTWTAVSATDAVFFVYQGGQVVINATELATPGADVNSAEPPSATIINNAVSLTVNVADQAGVAISGAQAAIHLADSPFTELMNEATTAGGVATETFNYASDTDITIRVRKSTTGSTRYFPVSATGTITAAGFSVDLTMTEDLIASA